MELSDRSLIIDVREREEYENEHIRESLNIPFSHFQKVAPNILSHVQTSELIFICQDGKQSLIARGPLKDNPALSNKKIQVFPGGIEAWKQQGLPIIRHKNQKISIRRQVQMIVGCLIPLSISLGILATPWWFLLTTILGCGVFVAGASGHCIVGHFLQKMPWNCSHRLDG